MAMVVAPTQDRGIAELTQGVRMVVKHTFLDLVEDDEFNVHPLIRARPRSFSDPMLQFSATKCKMDLGSAASTDANDTDDDETVANGTFDLPLFGESDDDIEEVVQSDDEDSVTAIQAPPGVWAQPALATQTFVPVCVTFVPVIQQPMWPQKSSRSARRRRARAVNRWYRYNTQTGADGEQQDEAAFDDEDGDFDDDWQLPESDDVAESSEIDGDSWPVLVSPCEVDEKQTIKA